MIARLQLGERELAIDLDKPLDISIPMRSGADNPNAWYVGHPEFKPVKLDDWEGAVRAGAAVNFTSMHIIPHAHGTHTESLGHITAEQHSVNQSFHRYFYLAQVVSVSPESKNGDALIGSHQLQDHLKEVEAVVIRTLPNDNDKLSKQYSYSNWPYLTKEAAAMLCRKGVQHLLIDTPSVDREEDEGKLAAHRAFWDMDGMPREHATITEFIFVEDKIQDGQYVLELQLPNIESDAVPSRPVLYQILDSK